ncbi:MAG: hypothetical protein IJ196_03370 [Prevotella sp.]|nr:hypothetical protein [Prevotella sp.]
MMMLAAGCSTQKNTAKTRAWHSFKAKYNTYYNGKMAYIDGSLEKENGNKDNFTEMIPLYSVGNKRSKELGKGNFDKAIEKSQKTIKLHSIKRKPEWTKKRKKTERDIEWLNRKEYNPFLWKAWMLMGRSQFHKGAFDEAASTFSYMSRLYQTQPAIYGKARAWLAKCYIEQDWLYDAEDVIRNISRDSIHWSAQKEWDYTLADYYIHTKEYEKAIPYLQKVIKHEMRRKQKAREWFLLGQIQASLGRKELAYKAYQHVVSLSPPYEVEFNARIAMTEVYADTQGKKMISKLKRMAVSDKNKDYLDQVYYAIGNIYMSQKDTANAIAAYEKGNTKSSRNGIEKGVLLLRLGDIYWGLEKYNDAQRCYGEAIGLLDKDRDDYEMLSHRSQVLDLLVPYTDAVHLQDSLQELAKMNEKDRNAAIDRVIEALKKKEKEEKDRLAEQNAQQVQQRNGGTGRNTPNTATNNQANQQNGLWYFYNQMAVNQGKAQFEKLWGKRENVDNWQRINKTVVSTGNDFSDLTEEQLDSIRQVEAAADSLEQVTDSAELDPHKREYYLAQIPFTEEQIEASNMIIKDGLYNSGVIFKDKLDNLKLSQKALTRLTDQYPDYEGMDNAYYHLFLLYSRLGQHSIAATYIRLLQDNYPESQWTSVLTDPYFEENSRFGLHLEDSLYAATYEAFKADRYAEVRTNSTFSEQRFPMGSNRDKFIFINGLGRLNNGDADGCLESMKELVEKFPQSKLSEMAGMIINGVNQGRRLRGGKFDIGDVWQRRTAVLNDEDSIANRELSNERNTDFVFMIAYKPDSLDENKLLYEVAKYNFTSYLVRNFDISIDDDGGLHRMMISGFRNYDEALQYARALHQQAGIIQNMSGGRSIIISEENLQLLGVRFSYNEYDDFYNKHFAPLKVSTLPLLIEPTKEDFREPEEPTIEEIDKLLDNPDNYNNGLDVETTVEEETIIGVDEETTVNSDDNNAAEEIISAEDNPANAEDIPVDTEETPVAAESKDDNETDNTVPVDPQKEPIEPVSQPDNTPEPAEQTDQKQETEDSNADENLVVPTEETESPVDENDEDNTVIPAEITDEDGNDDETIILFDDDETPDIDEEEIPVDDGNSTPPAKQQEEKQPLNPDDIDDEYYELDGF